MKKFRKVILTLIVFVVVCLTLIACEPKAVVNDDYFGEYVPDIKGEAPIDMDAGMTIDGLNDESVWEGKQTLTLTSRLGKSSEKLDESIINTHVDYVISSHFGEKGVYFYIENNDKVINVMGEDNQRKQNAYPTGRTATVIYLCAEDTPLGDPTDSGIELTISADGEIYVQKTYRYPNSYNEFTSAGIAYAAHVINGNLNEYGNGAADGYAVETYVPWEKLGLTQKPAQIRARFAAIRHASYQRNDVKRLYERIDSVASGNQKKWFVFTENGARDVFPTTIDSGNFVIDGNDAEWTAYTGNVPEVNIYSVDEQGNPTAEDTDPRYVKYKMLKTDKGLMIYLEALQRLYLTTRGRETIASCIELVIASRNGGKETLFMNPNYFPEFQKGVFTCVNTETELPSTGEKLKKITAEWFIPNATLDKRYDVDVSGDSIRAGLAFCNGQWGSVSDGELELSTEEVIVPQSVGAGTSKPFNFFAVSPYDVNNLHTVNANGIV